MPHHTTPHHTTSLSPIRIAHLHRWISHDIESLASALRIKDTKLLGRLVLDDKNPDFIIFSEWCMTTIDKCNLLKHYLRHNRHSVFIFMTGECIEPDLNIFDYAIIFNRDLMCGDRIAHNLPCLYKRLIDDTIKNDLTSEQACQCLTSGLRFCNFIYSHANEPRDTYFYMLSKYKQVDSLGGWLNNTNTNSTRYASNYYEHSIQMKSRYKFSLAMENASCKGYTTEKIVSSLQAHTVPIYWGDPAVTDYINPKAFINCHDYSSFDEVIERVKEIDNNDELWLDMVTQPWQTEEQYARTLHEMEDYTRFTENILSQDVRSAKRRTEGLWSNNYRKCFTGMVGIMPPLYLRAFRKLRHIIGMLLSDKTKTAIKHFLHMD